MAMSIPSLVVLKNITDVLKQQNITNNRIACLGYPDILAHTEHIKTIFGESIAANLQYHPDSESIIRWHGVGRLTDRIVEAKHFFGLLGYELEIFDIVKARGDEIVLDLNVPMPKKI